MVDELVAYSKLSKDQKSIWSAATLLDIRNSVSLLRAPEVWSVLDTLKKKIDLYSASIILSPKLSAYVTGNAPRKLLVQLLERHPSWGFTKAVQDTPTQNDAVLALISAKLTDRRYAVKKLIADSIGSIAEDTEDMRRQDADDIVTLCTALATKVYKRIGFVVTVPMCGRVAFLRQVYAEHHTAGDKFWGMVDRCLREFRVRFPSEVQLSSAFSRILTQDRSLYGTLEDADLDAIVANAGTEKQIQCESEAVVSGTASTVTPIDETEDDSSDED